MVTTTFYTTALFVQEVYWVAETRDPTAESIPAIVDALEQLNPEAARAFVEAYLGRAIGELSPKQFGQEN